MAHLEEIDENETPYVPKPLEQTSWLKSLLVVFAAILIVPLFAFAPWLAFNLLDPSKKLPFIFVRPSIGNPSQVCQNFDDVKVADPYQRPSEFQDPSFQTLKYCEDAEFIEELGVSLISCDNGRNNWNTVMGTMFNPNPRGALWIFEQEEYLSSEEKKKSGPSPSIVKLQDYPEYFDFHPLGTTTFTAKESGKTTLFVVNHGRAYTSVEVFDLSKKNGGWVADYLRTVTSPLGTHTANSLVALSPTSLLVTNDHLFAHRPPSKESLIAALTPSFGSSLASYLATPLGKAPLCVILAKVETLLGLPLSWVSHVEWKKSSKQVPVEGKVDSKIQQETDFAVATEGVSTKVVAKGISFANGISLSPNGSILAVASTTYPGINLYSLSKDSNSKPELIFQSRLHTPFGVDNINFSPIEKKLFSSIGFSDDLFNGASLIASGHPWPIKLIKMAKAPEIQSNSAGSWVIKIEPSSRNPYSTESKDGDVVKQSIERDRAPFPIAKRALSTLRKWNMKTLYQGDGNPVEVVKVDEDGKTIGKRLVGVASSSSGAYDPNSGLLIVSGLYSGVMVCDNVGLV